MGRSLDRANKQNILLQVQFRNKLIHLHITVQPDLVCQQLPKTQLEFLISLDKWLTDKQNTVCETEILHIKPLGEQQISTTGDCTLTISFHSVQLSLPVQIRNLLIYKKILQLSGDSEIDGCANYLISIWCKIRLKTIRDLIQILRVRAQ